MEVEWPAVWTRDTPPPEAGARLVLVRGVALLAIAATLGYLVWRATSTLAGSTLWLAIPFLALECATLVSLALTTFDLWDLDAVRGPPDAPVALRVAAIIPTRGEPREVLLATVAAAVALQPAHETWIVDEQDRPWVRALARRIGAQYRSGEHVNALLPELDADVVAFLDADNVASAAFLHRTLPYFADPRVALVQTPRDFSDTESFEHVAVRGGSTRLSEREQYHRVVSSGRNRHHSALWTGTNAVLRLSALRQVGGIATDTLSGDVRTTIRLHRHGWQTVFHNEVLARGLSSADSARYLSERQRCGAGALQNLKVENPALGSGLTLPQRVSHLSTLLSWFDSWRTLAYALVPVLVLLSGAVPVAASPAVFLPAFVGALLVRRLALWLLSRGHGTGWNTALFAFIRMPASLRAVLERRPRPFAVRSQGDERPRTATPKELVILAVLGAFALVWWAVSLAGWTPVRYPVGWIAGGAVVWVLANTVLILGAIRRVRSARYGVERRASVRFEVHGHAVVNNQLARLHDLSLTGASLRVAVPPVRGQHLTLRLTVDGSMLQLPVIVRTATEGSRGGGERTWTQIGVEFHDLTDSQIARLALSLFSTGMTPHVSSSSSSGTAA